MPHESARGMSTLSRHLFIFLLGFGSGLGTCIVWRLQSEWTAQREADAVMRWWNIDWKRREQRCTPESE
jgi:hypothetical protein